MRPRQVLTSLIVPAAALSLPTSPSGNSSPSSLTARDDALACGLYQYPSPPTNPPACWVWYAPTTSPSDYCGPSTQSTLSSASAASSLWLDSCTSLRAAQVSSQRDFFLADYATNEFNTLLTSGECAFQVQPATPPSSDQIYVGGTDVVDVLQTAIDTSRAAGGKTGVEGSMTCSPGEVKWRVVPV
ncbi:hypothetical protein F4804DRAFT_12009 [Jackrogersella minutella]|nr:hypothetical protein F4804DRAFT_12009 [Jackrogersella minutella]